MTIETFNALDEMSQAEAIWERGVFLGSHDSLPYRYILYRVDDFYVEVCYHCAYNIIRNSRSFDADSLSQANTAVIQRDLFSHAN